MTQRSRSNGPRSKRLKTLPLFDELPKPFAERLFAHYLSLEDLRRCFLVSWSWNRASECGVVPALVDKIDQLSNSMTATLEIVSLLYLLRAKDSIAADRARIALQQPNPYRVIQSSYDFHKSDIPLYNPDAGHSRYSLWRPWRAVRRNQANLMFARSDLFWQIDNALKRWMPVSAALESLGFPLNHIDCSVKDANVIFSALLAHSFPVYALEALLALTKARNWTVHPSKFNRKSEKRLTAKPWSLSYLKQVSRLGEGTFHCGCLIAEWLLWEHDRKVWSPVYQEILESGFGLGGRQSWAAAKIAWLRLPLDLRVVDGHPWLQRANIDSMWWAAGKALIFAEIANQFWSGGTLKNASQIIRKSVYCLDPVAFLDTALPKINRLECLQQHFASSTTRPSKYGDLVPIFKRLGFELTCPPMESCRCSIRKLY